MNAVNAITRALRRGPRTSAELSAALGVSQSTVSRALSQILNVVQMGRGRASRYGLADELMDVSAQAHTVFRVTAGGEAIAIGRIAAIVGAAFWYENLEAPSRSREFPSLPWFLQDLRPQGFLGRSTVRDFASRGWPSQLDLWTDRQVLASLVQSNAHDHIGNLLIGDRSAEAFRQGRNNPLRPALPADVASRLQRYQRAVNDMGTNVRAGSSVHGEQPKFTAEVEIPGSGETRSVLVKFSPPMNTEVGRRWADLLRMEERSLGIIASQLGISAARATWLSCGERAYLEVDRFDRLPDGGRLGVVSFTQLDAEYVGKGQDWYQVASSLVLENQLAAGDENTIAVLEFFGDLIGNNDRHLGNVSVIFTGVRPMSLSPTYDLLPMIYAPTAIGMNSSPLSIKPNLDELHRHVPVDIREAVCEAALTFWKECAEDDVLSAGMREICSKNSATIEARLAGMR